MPVSISTNLRTCNLSDKLLRSTSAKNTRSVQAQVLSFAVEVLSFLRQRFSSEKFKLSTASQNALTIINIH